MYTYIYISLDLTFVFLYQKWTYYRLILTEMDFFMLDLTRIMVRSGAAIWFSKKEISFVNANAAKHSFIGE